MRLPLLEVSATNYRAIGAEYGTQWATEARELFDIRLALTLERGAFADEASLIAVAQAHVPVLAEYDRPLYDEFLGVCDATGLQPWQLVILNHYTDFRDIPADSGGCSVVYTPTDGGPVAAQTWDMHASAMPYVSLMRITPNDGPSSVLFTVMGCFGMAGMNDAGVSVCINNLTPDDARVGILWPALVRRMLREETAQAAKRVLTEAPLSSGHNYLIADAVDVFNVEATALKQRVTHADPSTLYWHTNHYLDCDLQAVEKPLHPQSTTKTRYERLSQLMPSTTLDADSLWEILSSHDGYPQSLCSHMAGDEPSASRTCGAVLCDIRNRKIVAARGCLHEADVRVVQVVV